MPFLQSPMNIELIQNRNISQFKVICGSKNYGRKIIILVGFRIIVI